MLIETATFETALPPKLEAETAYVDSGCLLYWAKIALRLSVIFHAVLAIEGVIVGFCSDSSTVIKASESTDFAVIAPFIVALTNVALPLPVIWKPDVS